MIPSLAAGQPAASPAFPSAASEGTDFIALWKRALDAAHAVSGERRLATDAAPGAEPDGHAAPAAAAARADRRSADSIAPNEAAQACARIDPAPLPDRTPQTVPDALVPVQARASGSTGGSGTRPGGLETRPSSRAAAVPGEMPEAPSPAAVHAMQATRSVPVRAGVAVDEPAPAPEAAADRLPVPDESVHVFVGDHGLEVVVRHAGMAPQAAVLCALETARQLTGDRKSLHHVVLNGSTIYQDSVSLGVSPPGDIVHFTC